MSLLKYSLNGPTLCHMKMPFSGVFGTKDSMRVQLGQAAALYCRVSTADQTCARQERDLRAFARKAGYKVVGVWKETASGAKQERAERQEGPGVGAGPQGRRDPRHRTDPLGPLDQVRRAVLNVL